MCLHGELDLYRDDVNITIKFCTIDFNVHYMYVIFCKHALLCKFLYTSSLKCLPLQNFVTNSVNVRYNNIIRLPSEVNIHYFHKSLQL